MMTVQRLTCLWPGFARLWFRGEWIALLNACAFAGLLNGLIVTTLLWTEVAPVSLRLTGWGVAALWWLAGAGMSLRKLPDIAASNANDANQGLFVAAQNEYLKGNWIEAETYARRLLRRMPRDIESLLLLATIHRRTRRYDDARGELQQIARLDAADRWQVELRKEREMLRRESEREKIEQLGQTSSPFDVSPNDKQQTTPETTDTEIAAPVTIEQSDPETTPLKSDLHDNRRAA